MASSDTLTSKAIAVPVLVTLLAGGIYLLGKQMELTGSTKSTIAVEGLGRVYAAPDVAVLQFGVNTGRQSTAEKTLTVLTKNMDAVIAAVKENGVDQKDISTQSLWLNPAYDWIDGQQVSRGFEATQNLSVKVRDLEKIGKLLTAAAAAGANQIGGVTMTIDDPEDLKAQARATAIADAQKKADVLADSLGVHLGKIVSYAEGYNGSASYDKYNYGMGGGGGAEMAVPAGEQEIVINVTVNYEIR